MLSVMWRGPVPQFMPMTSIGNGASAVSAAPISVPFSIVPNTSIVTCAITGTRTTMLFEVLKDRGQRRLCLQKVLTGFDDQQIDAAVEQPAHLFGIGRLLDRGT